MEQALPGSPIEFYGISYDDPLIAGENRCLYDLCARVTPTAKVKGNNYRTIAEGAYLCCHYTGHVKELSRLYNDLFGVWMPHRGHVMGPGLCFERYHAAELPEGHVDMDLCVPVQ